MPPLRVLQLLSPRSYVLQPGGVRGRVPGPGQVFCMLPGQPSEKTSVTPAYPDGGAGSGVPLPCPSSQHWGEGVALSDQPGPEQLTYPL